MPTAESPDLTMFLWWIGLGIVLALVLFGLAAWATIRLLAAADLLAEPGPVPALRKGWLLRGLYALYGRARQERSGRFVTLPDHAVADLLARADRVATATGGIQESLQTLAGRVERVCAAVEALAGQHAPPTAEAPAAISAPGASSQPTDLDATDPTDSIVSVGPDDFDPLPGLEDWADHTAGAERGATAPAPPAEFRIHVQKLFNEWCQNSRKPVIPTGIELKCLYYEGTQGGSELEGALPRFREGPTSGDFVRFSAADDKQAALVFPNPGIAPDLAVVQLLYPRITADSLRDRHRLVGLPPIPMQRREDFWEPDT